MRTTKRDQPFVQNVANKNCRKTLLEIQNIPGTELSSAVERTTGELNLYNKRLKIVFHSFNKYLHVTISSCFLIHSKRRTPF